MNVSRLTPEDIEQQLLDARAECVRFLDAIEAVFADVHLGVPDTPRARALRRTIADIDKALELTRARAAQTKDI